MHVFRMSSLYTLAVSVVQDAVQYTRVVANMIWIMMFERCSRWVDSKVEG